MRIVFLILALIGASAVLNFVGSFIGGWNSGVAILFGVVTGFALTSYAIYKGWL